MKLPMDHEQAQALPEHLSLNEQAGLLELVWRLRQRYGDRLRRVVLFGSKARGDYDEESDVDLLVLLRVPKHEYWAHWHEVVDLAWEIGFAHGFVTSVVLRHEDDYERIRRDGLLFARNIERDGIELWTTQPSAHTLQHV